MQRQFPRSCMRSLLRGTAVRSPGRLHALRLQPSTVHMRADAAGHATMPTTSMSSPTTCMQHAIAAGSMAGCSATDASQSSGGAASAVNCMAGCTPHRSHSTPQQRHSSTTPSPQQHHRCPATGDELAGLVKSWEAATDMSVSDQKPFILRLDGVSFKTYTQGMQKPFDSRLVDR